MAIRRVGIQYINPSAAIKDYQTYQKDISINCSVASELFISKLNMKTAVFICIAAFSALAVSQPTKTIVDILQQNDNKDRFSTLVQAAQAAGIVENLQKGIFF